MPCPLHNPCVCCVLWGVRVTWRGVGAALGYLHENQVVHRDIKLANLMLAQVCHTACLSPRLTVDTSLSLALFRGNMGSHMGSHMPPLSL